MKTGGGGTAAAPHTLQTPKPLWSEQDRVSVQASATAVRAVLQQAGVSGRACWRGADRQMHGLVLLDGQGQVLRPPFCGMTSARSAVR